MTTERGHWHWRSGPVDPGAAIVFDVDGVISDATDRQHYLQPGAMRWTEFFDACGQDELIAENAALSHLLAPDLAVVLLTARPVRVRPQTLEWLDRHPMRWDLLIMRGRGMGSTSQQYKADAIADLRAEGFDPRLAIDDDQANVEVFRELGIPTIYHHSGYYE